MTLAFRKAFDGEMYTRQNIFPMNEREATRLEKDLWKAGFAVRVTEFRRGWYVWTKNSQGLIK